MLSSINGEFSLWQTYAGADIFEVNARVDWTGRKTKKEMLQYLQEMQAFASAAADLVSRSDAA